MQNDNVKFKSGNSKENFKKEFIKRLIRYSIRLVRFCDKLKEERVSFCIIDQVIDSGTSMGSNVVEAKSAHSTKDYIKFFEIALKSSNETKYWLLVIKEISKSNKDEAGEILKETIEISNILASSVLTLKKKK